MSEKNVPASEDSLECLVRLRPGIRYTKNGISMDIHDVKNGEVYVQRWPKGIKTQSAFDNLRRMSVEKALTEMQGARLEPNNSSSATASQRLTQTD